MSMAGRGMGQAVPSLGLVVPRAGRVSPGVSLGGGLAEVGEEDEVEIRGAGAGAGRRPSPTIDTNTNGHSHDHGGHSHDTSQSGHSHVHAHSNLPAPITITAPTPIETTHPSLPTNPNNDDDEFLPLSPPPGTQAFIVTHQQISSASSTNSTPPTASSNAHARKHSRIHERNLSAFFPRPGQQTSAVGYGDTYEDPTGAGAHGGESIVPNAGAGGVQGVGGGEDGGAAAAKAARRGHHHKHSMSHNFFSFMDPTATPQGTGNDLLAANAARNGSAAAVLVDKFSASPSASTPNPNSAFLPAPSHALPRSKYAALPAPVRLVMFCAAYLPLSTQLGLVLAVVQTALGAVLWVSGQAGESLAVTGLGYLVVFDGMGTLGRVCLEMPGNGMEVVWGLMSGPKGDRSVRMPFG